MKKPVVLFASLACAAMLCTGCAGNGGASSAASSQAAASQAASQAASAPAASQDTGSAAPGVLQATNGFAEGRIGETFQTAFFTYTVDSVSFVDEYENYRPAEGMQLVDVVVSIRNTLGSELPMSIYDFQIQWHDLGDGDEDFDYGVILPGSETAMPENYRLRRAEGCTWHILCEVPAEAASFSLSYLEIFADESRGNVFFTYFEKEDGQAV